MQINSNISFTNNENQPPQRGNFFGALKDSFLNVAGTAAAGGALGAGAGKLVSLTPYKPSETALNFQFADMFEKTVKSDEIPDFIKQSGDEIKGFVKQGQKFAGDYNGIIDSMEKIALKQKVQEMAEEAIAEEKTQSFIREFFKDAKDAVPDGGYKKADILERLKDVATDEKTVEGLKERKNTIEEQFENIRQGFIKKASELKDSIINKYAQDGAKHLRKRTIIGAGIAIGAGVALVLNLLRTYGVIGKKGAPDNQTAPNPASAPLKTTQG